MDAIHHYSRGKCFISNEQRRKRNSFEMVEIEAKFQNAVSDINRRNMKKSGITLYAQPSTINTLDDVCRKG